MSISFKAAGAVEAGGTELAVAPEQVLREVRGSGPDRGVRRLAERGLTTIEYAIGLVAAATAALVLLRIFNDNTFFRTLFDWVLGVFDMLVA